MRIVICDDDKEFVSKLNNNLLSFFEKNKMTTPEIQFYYSGEDLLLDQGNKDIVFLDVEMAGIDGISVGKSISSISKNSIIIIITSYSEYLDDAMRFNVFRYISKPLDTKRLYRNLKDAIEAYKRMQDNRITFDCNNTTVSCNTSQILYVEIDGKKINLRTTENSYSFYGTISQFEKDLPSVSFFRCHRSFIVNLAHVRQFSEDEIFLDNSDSIYLSKRKHGEFKKKWLEYIGSTK